MVCRIDRIAVCYRRKDLRDRPAMYYPAAARAVWLLMEERGLIRSTAFGGFPSCMSRVRFPSPAPISCAKARLSGARRLDLERLLPAKVRSTWGRQSPWTGTAAGAVDTPGLPGEWGIGCARFLG